LLETQPRIVACCCGMVCGCLLRTQQCVELVCLELVVLCQF
jgi:hypothetical protein